MLKCFLSVVVVIGGWSSGGFVSQGKEKREAKRLYNIIETWHTKQLNSELAAVGRIEQSKKL